MYKNRLQELCHKKGWAFPTYGSEKVGPDHNPRFKASVTVNGLSFESTQFARSSKEAQGEAARLAFEHLTCTGGIPSGHEQSAVPTVQVTRDSSSGSSKLDEASIPNVQAETKLPGSSRDFNSNQMNLSVATDMGVRDSSSGSSKLDEASITNVQAGTKLPGTSKDFYSNEMNLSVATDMGVRGLNHLSKNQLLAFSQRRNIPPPVYSSSCDGPPHAFQFKAMVTIDGQTFESPEFFRTRKDAEHAAAKVALMSLTEGEQEIEHSDYKNMLQAMSIKKGFSVQYETDSSGASHMPTFFSTVKVGDEVFSGEAGKTKKQAEMSAAKIAFLKLCECKSRMQELMERYSPVKSISYVDLPPKPTHHKAKTPSQSIYIQTDRPEDDYNENEVSRSEELPSSSYRTQHDPPSTASIVAEKNGSEDHITASTGKSRMQELMKRYPSLKSISYVDLPPKPTHHKVKTPSQSIYFQTDRPEDDNHENAASRGEELPSCYRTQQDPPSTAIVAEKNGSEDHIKASAGSPSALTNLNKKFNEMHMYRHEPFLSESLDAEDGASSSLVHSEHPSGLGSCAAFSTRKRSQFLGNKIQVYPRVENMKLPEGAVPLPFSDDNWVAAKFEGVGDC